MSKKKFVEEFCEIYPSSRDLSQKWFVKYRLGGVAFGKWMKANVPNLPNAIDRERKAKEILEAIKANKWKPLPKKAIKANAVYIAQGLDMIDQRKSSLSDKSFPTMQTHFRKLNEYCVEKGHKSISANIADEFLDYLMSLGRHPKTVNNYRITFNSTFNKLVEKGAIRKNPFLKTEKKKGESECPNWFKEHEFDKLESYMRSFDANGDYNEGFLWAAARWVFYCLMRPCSTLREVRVADVDWTRWQVKLKYNNTKNSDSYWVPIPDELKDDIKPLKLWTFPPSYYLVGHNGLPSKTQVGKNFWNRHFKEVLRVLEFISDGYYFYCLKHSGFAHGYLNGVSIIELQMLAGHKDIRQTMRYMKRLGLEDFPDLRNKFRKLNTKK